MKRVFITRVTKDAHALQSEKGKRLVGGLGIDDGTTNGKIAFRRLVDRAQQVEHGGLARTALAENDDEFAAATEKRYIKHTLHEKIFTYKIANAMTRIETLQLAAASVWYAIRTA